MAWRDTVLGLTLAESLQLMIDEKALSTKDASEIIAAFDEARARARARARRARARALERASERWRRSHRTRARAVGGGGSDTAQASTEEMSKSAAAAESGGGSGRPGGRLEAAMTSYNGCDDKWVLRLASGCWSLQ